MSDRFVVVVRCRGTGQLLAAYYTASCEDAAETAKKEASAWGPEFDVFVEDRQDPDRYGRY